MSKDFSNSLFPDWIPPEPPPIASKGHAGRPGAGPDGETCGTCKHRYRHVMSKTYQKCNLTKWTHGSATDIRARDPACQYWEAT